MQGGDGRGVAAAERGECGGVWQLGLIVFAVALDSEQCPFLWSATARTAGGLLGEVRIALAHEVADLVVVGASRVLSHRSSSSHAAGRAEELLQQELGTSIDLVADHTRSRGTGPSRALTGRGGERIEQARDLAESGGDEPVIGPVPEPLVLNQASLTQHLQVMTHQRL